MSAEADSLLQKMQDHEQELLEARRQQSERCSRSRPTYCALRLSSRWRCSFCITGMLNAELRAREQAEASLRTLSVRLLELQDQERRKIFPRTSR